MPQVGSPFTVIFEDNHLLVVNKAAGVLVQGDATGDVPLVDLCKDYIKVKYKKPGEVFLGVVHRLDRPVSGIVVLARTSKSLERMNALFRDKQTTKTYLAIVKRKPPQPEGKLIHWLVKDETKNKTTAYKQEVSGSLKSELSYRILGTAEGVWLLEVNPVTGRSHQIRVQLGSIGSIIAGDVKYGDKDPAEDGRIYLHARKLAFVHPVKKEPMVFNAFPPSVGMWKYFAKFGEL
ncbi:MAG: RluA family pseudouridine synthase [Chryseolinea sp.]